MERGFNGAVTRVTADVDVVRAHVGRCGSIGDVVVFGRVNPTATHIGDTIVNTAFEQIYIAEKLVNERRGGMIVDLIGGADLFNLAVVDHHHAVGDFERLFLIVRHEHAGEIDFIVQSAQPAAQFFAHFRIQCTEGLIEQQHLRLDGQRARERDTLPLTTGKLMRVAIRQPVELNELQQLMHASADFFLGGTQCTRPHTQPECDVFKNAHMSEQRVMLEYKPHLAFLHTGVGGVFVVEKDAPAVGLLQTGDHAQQRCLTRARRAQQRDQFAGLDFQADAIERIERPETLGYIEDLYGHSLNSFSRFSSRTSTTVLITSVTTASSANSDAQANAAAN